MSKSVRNSILVILVMLICILAVVLGIHLASKSSESETQIVNGVVISVLDKAYEQVLVTSYEEYDTLMDEYDVRDVVLTNSSFDEYDYIVDFIYYDDTLEIYDIEVNLSDLGITINYVVNESIDGTDKYLMYFIPIDKGILDELNIYEINYEIEEK